MKGKLIKIDPEKREVFIEDIDGFVMTFQLADIIKIDYVREGNVTFSVDVNDKKKITFIKNEYEHKQETPPIETAYNKIYNRPRDPEEQKLITNQWALNCALEYFKINKEDLKGLISLDHIKIQAKAFKDILREI